MWTPKDSKEPAVTKPATWELDLNGETVKLNQVVARSGPALFGGFGGPPGPLPPTVVMSAVRESDGKKVTLTITFKATDFNAENTDLISVQGMLTEGDGFAFGPGMKSFDGKVQLKTAEEKAGAAVEGTLTGKLYEMKGGFGG